MSDNTAEKQQEELDLEVEIIDDVPEEDKNKVRNEDAPKDNIPDDEEIKQYSKDVQKRLNKIKYEYHEERRLKEAAEREKEEAVTNLQKLLDENKKLRKTLDDGEGVLVEQAKKRVGAEIEAAKPMYKQVNNERLEFTDADYDQAKIDLGNSKWEAQQFGYIQARQESYPALSEQWDMLFHDMTSGKGDKTGEWYKAIKKIKDDNPKPS